MSICFFVLVGCEGVREEVGYKDAAASKKKKNTVHNFFFIFDMVGSVISAL